METLIHYGIKGQKWGTRRWQYADGRFNEEGKKRYFSNKQKYYVSNANGQDYYTGEEANANFYKDKNGNYRARKERINLITWATGLTGGAVALSMLGIGPKAALVTAGAAALATVLNRKAAEKKIYDVEKIANDEYYFQVAEENANTRYYLLRNEIRNNRNY